MSNRRDGDPSYSFVGQVYPEVIAHFEREGFKVKKLESDTLTAMAKGLPVYLFMVGDIALTEEELQEAEAIESLKEEDDDSDEGIPDFLAAMMGGLR